ncbi:cupin domain-containing protein [Sphingobacterium sp. IITKGP-BTPF85]|uniref:cupin domain-containing protein n=1 Tax=Sphingobacterium sp. IITKGP-BTPF85 TaxID=1338009 RepID=UPI00038A2299|nr:cupin domain-containing protein [Sphingobacterium sp. IITKGP-BTPF85]KKX47495.1 cupin [Sphingobacterium sp. IITKGP-BTPF85]
MALKNTENSEHYLWGDNCDGWHLLKSDSLSIIQEKMPPHTSEGLHFHNNAQQFFYILKGTATFRLEESTVEVSKNNGFHILPQQKHQIFNHTEQDLEFLVISEPKAHGDRVNL